MQSELTGSDALGKRDGLESGVTEKVKAGHDELMERKDAESSPNIGFESPLKVDDSPARNLNAPKPPYAPRLGAKPDGQGHEEEAQGDSPTPENQPERKQPATKCSSPALRTAAAGFGSSQIGQRQQSLRDVLIAR